MSDLTVWLITLGLVVSGIALVIGADAALDWWLDQQEETDQMLEEAWDE